MPFIVHRPGSQLGSMGACLDGIQYSLVDVAPTVAAMLRVPAPRHSAGTYIKPLFDAEESVVTVTTTRRIEPPGPRHASLVGFLTTPSDVRRGAQAGHEAEVAGEAGYALQTWQWKDLYHQRHAEIEGFLSHPEVAFDVRAAPRPRAISRVACEP